MRATLARVLHRARWLVASTRHRVRFVEVLVAARQGPLTQDYLPWVGRLRAAEGSLGRPACVPAGRLLACRRAPRPPDHLKRGTSSRNKPTSSTLVLGSFERKERFLARAERCGQGCAHARHAVRRISQPATTGPATPSETSAGPAFPPSGTGPQTSRRARSSCPADCRWLRLPPVIERETPLDYLCEARLRPIWAGNNDCSQPTI